MFRKLPFINEILRPPFKASVLQRKLTVLIHWNSRIFSFNPFEAQIDTGNMMQALLKRLFLKYFNSQPANSNLLL
jgi:hypothetical protein